MTLRSPHLGLGGITLLNFHSLSPRQAAMTLDWRNCSGVRKWMYSSRKITPAEHSAFRAALKDDRENGYWIVKSLGRAGWAGVVYLNRIGKPPGCAWLGVYANPRSVRPGNGDILMEALIRLAFTRLRLRKLRLEVFSDNKKAVNFYTRKGFKTVRFLRGHFKRRGVPVDVKVMELKNRTES